MWSKKQKCFAVKKLKTKMQKQCQLEQTSYIKRIKVFLFAPYNKHLINRALCISEF